MKRFKFCANTFTNPKVNKEGLTLVPPHPPQEFPTNSLSSVNLKAVYLISIHFPQ